MYVCVCGQQGSAYSACFTHTLDCLWQGLALHLIDASLKCFSNSCLPFPPSSLCCPLPPLLTFQMLPLPPLPILLQLHFYASPPSLVLSSSPTGPFLSSLHSTLPSHLLPFTPPLQSLPPAYLNSAADNGVLTGLVREPQSERLVLNSSLGNIQFYSPLTRQLSEEVSMCNKHMTYAKCTRGMFICKFALYSFTL